MSTRPLTDGEIALARGVFGDAIDYGRARVANRKWFPFQPRRVTMAPLGTIHFHPAGGLYCDDFGCAGLDAQGLFIHELVHVWQHQRGIFLPIARHPFCRYGYSLRPGWRLTRYGIEQQAEIVRHVFLLRQGAQLPGAPPLDQYRGILPFG
ncbi:MULTISPECIES: vgr related protein [unclassified Sphingomonas]|uniref:vgr related protein n=1 Tax=unclassified Sphingomonas TaxID=196159 RepID=UPI00082D7C8E|nr:MULTISPECIES: vgr related protein [unclassified Sphingomonas]MCH4892157.1 vgr related protein [Sphingomonas sp. SFZ2018-12]